MSPMNVYSPSQTPMRHVTKKESKFKILNDLNKAENFNIKHNRSPMSANDQFVVANYTFKKRRKGSVKEEEFEESYSIDNNKVDDSKCIFYYIVV